VVTSAADALEAAGYSVEDERINRKHVYCSARCCWKIYGVVTREKAKKKRRAGAVCEVCGTAIEDQRAKSRTCSPRCRQKAYRDRKRSAR